MKTGMLLSGLIWLGLASVLSGCSGLELGGKLGLYAVDERREVQETASKHLPLKCRFVNCAGEGYQNDK